MGEALKSLVCCLCLTQDYIFFFSFPCDIAVLIWLHWWFLWERDYFRILKLAQERCWHLFLSKSGSACHWLCYKVPPILISGKECSQASPSDRCTILLSMGSSKYMTKNVPRKVEQWLVPLPLKRILVHHQTRQVWIIISPYFPPLKIPLVLELYRFYKKLIHYIRMMSVQMQSYVSFYHFYYILCTTRF